jgi:hypothetical protein
LQVCTAQCARIAAPGGTVQLAGLAAELILRRQLGRPRSGTRQALLLPRR